MKVLWYIPETFKRSLRGYDYNKMPASSWIRCLQIIPHFKKLGIDVAVNSFKHDAAIAVFLRRWQNADLQKAEMLKQQGTRIIVDTPVNYFSDQSLPAFSGGIVERFRAFVKIADLIVCSSEYTAQFGRKKGYNTVCIEDSIDLDRFSPFKKKRVPRSERLIWSGVSVKAGELNFLAPLIKRHHWKMTIISDKKPSLNMPYNWLRWDYKRFSKHILKGTLGIFPRQCDNEYDAGHSFFKIGVFLAQHIPVVCSPVPSYQKVTTPGNARVVSSLRFEEWEYAIQSVFKKEWRPDFSENPIVQFSSANIVEKYNNLFNKLL